MRRWWNLNGFFNEEQRFIFDTNRKLDIEVAEWKPKTEHEVQTTYNSINFPLWERCRYPTNLLALKSLTRGMWCPVLLSVISPQPYANSAWKCLSYSDLISPIHYPCLHDWCLLHICLVVLAAGRSGIYGWCSYLCWVTSSLLHLITVIIFNWAARSDTYYTCYTPYNKAWIIFRGHCNMWINSYHV